MTQHNIENIANNLIVNGHYDLEGAKNIVIDLHPKVYYICNIKDTYGLWISDNNQPVGFTKFNPLDRIMPQGDDISGIIIGGRILRDVGAVGRVREFLGEACPPDECYTASLYVRPEYQGKGYGSLLVATAAEISRQQLEKANETGALKNKTEHCFVVSGFRDSNHAMKTLLDSLGFILEDGFAYLYTNKATKFKSIEIKD